MDNTTTYRTFSGTLSHEINNDTNSEIQPHFPPELPGHPSASDLRLLQTVTMVLHRCYAPTLIVLGSLGNLLIIFAIRSTKLAKVPIMHFIFGIAVSDTLFLFSLVLEWCGRMSFRLTTQTGWCQSVYFISNMAMFMTLWFHVALIVERYINMCNETIQTSTFKCHIPNIACSTLRAKTCVLCVFVIGLVVYVNMCLTVDYALLQGPIAICLPQYHLFSALPYLDKVDIIVNVLIPYSIMAILLVRIAIELISRCKGREKAMDMGVMERRHWLAIHKQEVMLTASVLGLCGVYLILNTPSQILRAFYMTQTPKPTPVSELILQLILHAAYWTTFALNLPILLLTFKPFRRAIYFLFWSLHKKLRSCRNKDRTPLATVHFGVMFSTTLVTLNETSLM